MTTKGCGSLMLGLIVLAIGYAIVAPPYSVSLTCSWDNIYRLEATIAVAGKQYKGWAIHQESHSQGWLATMNAAGCPNTRGEAIAFRLDDGRAVLMRARLPEAARRAFEAGRTVDVAAFFGERSRYRFLVTDGYVFDSADAPRTAAPIRLDEGEIRLVGLSVERRWAAPDDDIDRVVPALLRTEFGGSALADLIHWTRRRDAGPPLFKARMSETGNGS